MSDNAAYILSYVAAFPALALLVLIIVGIEKFCKWCWQMIRSAGK